jgi:hypothetical protein
MASKSTIATENVYAPLVMVSFRARYRTLVGKGVHHNGSIDTNFDPALSTGNKCKKLVLIVDFLKQIMGLTYTLLIDEQCFCVLHRQ